MSVGRRLGAAGLVALCSLLPASPAGGQDREAIDRLLFEAERRQSDGDVEGALRNYELLSEQFSEAPQAAEALLRMVTGNRALGRPEAAEKAARALVGGHPRSPQAAAAYTHLGELLEAAAQDRAGLEEARAMFEKAVLLFPRASYPELPWRGAGALGGARLALRLGLGGEAARVLVDVIDHEPPSLVSASARLELAGLLLDVDRWQEAAELLQEVAGHAWSGDAERALATLAAGRLELIHRLWLRPAAGEPRWQRARTVGGAPQKPLAVAAHPDGRVAVSGEDGVSVVLAPDGSPAGRWSHEAPERSSWAGEVLLVATREVVAALPEGRGLRFAAPPTEKKPTLMPLRAVEAGDFGRWWVLAGKPERLLLYESERRRSRALIEGKGREPVDVTRDHRGRLLVLDRRERSVSRFTADGERAERLLTGGWRRAEALAADPAGNLYVLDRDGAIEIFDRRGERLEALGPVLPGGVELRRAQDLSVDGAGRLWIADGRIGLVVVE